MNIFISGASRGIGYELAKYFAAQRVQHIFMLSRNEKKLVQLSTECGTIYAKTKIVSLPYSLEEPETFLQLKQIISKYTDHLDVVINNAGSLVNKPFQEISASELQKVYQVNVFAPFQIIQCLMPLLGQQSKSHIVNIGSMGGVQGSVKFPGLSAYSSSKMAVAGLTECLAEEFKEKNIAVNCLAIGAVQTEMLQEAFPGYQAPLQPNEMAQYIGDFALKAHHYINGKIIQVSLSTP